VILLLLILFVSLAIIARELIVSFNDEDMNWDEASQYQKDIREMESIEVYWVIGSKQTFRGYEVQKRAIFAVNPDMALSKWQADMGNHWFIELVTTDGDKADKKILNS
jgi:hypothetical protein